MKRTLRRKLPITEVAATSSDDEAAATTTPAAQERGSIEVELERRQREHDAARAREAEEAQQAIEEAEAIKQAHSEELRAGAQARAETDRVMAATEQQTFVAASQFRGPKPGFVFKMDGGRLGYHRDPVAAASTAKKQAAAANQRAAREHAAAEAAAEAARLPLPAGADWDLRGAGVGDEELSAVLERAEAAGVVALDLRRNGVTDRGLQTLVATLAVGKVPLLRSLRLSGGTITPEVRKRLLPVMVARRPELDVDLELPEVIHAELAVSLDISNEEDEQEEEQEEQEEPEPQPQPQREHSQRSPSQSRAQEDGARTKCWLLPHGAPPAESGEMPHLTVHQTPQRTMRRYQLGGVRPNQPPVDVSIQERDAEDSGHGALLGDAAWGAAIALAVWVHRDAMEGSAEAARPHPW